MALYENSTPEYIHLLKILAAGCGAFWIVSCGTGCGFRAGNTVMGFSSFVDSINELERTKLGAPMHEPYKKKEEKAKLGQIIDKRA